MHTLKTNKTFKTHKTSLLIRCAVLISESLSSLPPNWKKYTNSDKRQPLAMLLFPPKRTAPLFR